MIVTASRRAYELRVIYYAVPRHPAVSGLCYNGLYVTQRSLARVYVLRAGIVPSFSLQRERLLTLAHPPYAAVGLK